MKDTTTRKTEAPAAGAKPAKPRAPRAAADEEDAHRRRRDRPAARRPSSGTRCSESVAAAEEAQANALTDILAGAFPRRMPRS